MARGVGGHSPANVQKHLKGQEYPARKEDLLKTARSNNAPAEIIETIEGLPDEEFGGPQDVMKGYGEKSVSTGPRSLRRIATGPARATVMIVEATRTSTQSTAASIRAVNIAATGRNPLGPRAEIG